MLPFPPWFQCDTSPKFSISPKWKSSLPHNSSKTISLTPRCAEIETYAKVEVFVLNFVLGFLLKEEQSGLRLPAKRLSALTLFTILQPSFCCQSGQLSVWEGTRLPFCFLENSVFGHPSKRNGHPSNQSTFQSLVEYSLHHFMCPCRRNPSPQKTMGIWLPGNVSPSGHQEESYDVC